jgi:hypothetical protein
MTGNGTESREWRIQEGHGEKTVPLLFYSRVTAVP